jgi:NDP-sugar pyrophosphorylase family protein
LTPVDNPTAYGLVETDPAGNVQAFVEKPKAEEIRCDTINAGVYVLEADTLDRIPPDTPYSIERGYFPSLIARGETFVAHIYRGYWIDIGTPEKYRQAHHDIMTGRFRAAPFLQAPGTMMVSPDARVGAEVAFAGPCFVGGGTTIDRGARIGAYTVIGEGCHIGEGAWVDGAILWPGTVVGAHARVGAILAGRGCRFGDFSTLSHDAVFGDGSIVTEYSKA